MCFDISLIKTKNKLLPELETVLKPREGKDIRIELHRKGGSRFFMIGWVHLVYLYDWRTNSYFLETHSYTHEKYRGCGYGVYLYSLAAEYAFEHGLSIRSSVRRSENAQRLWKSKTLRMFYEVVKVGSGSNYRWEMLSKKEMMVAA